MVAADSRILYTALVAAVAFARVVELLHSRRNLRRLRDRGGVESGAAHYPAMVAVHAGLLISCVVEVWLGQRPWVPLLGWSMVALLTLTMAVRLWTMAALGDRWVTRVVVIPGAPPVRTGPYRWLRHPNYLAVAVEVVALPLVHTAWLTALVFGLLDAAVLAVRVGVENRALGAVKG